MDIKEYIASGILENYVLGLVSEEEKQRVESYARQYSEVQEELIAIEDALSQYALTKAKPMPEGLSMQILDHINELAKTDIPPPADDTTPSTTLKKTSPKSADNSPDNWIKGLLGLLTLLGLGAAAFLYQENTNLRNTQISTNQQLVDQQLSCDEIQQQQQQLEEQLNILRDDAYRSILMKGTEKAPNAVAAIYHNEAAKKTYLDVRNLPTPTTDKQYQLWAIVDGTPVDMGVFNLPIDTITFVEVPFIENAQAFAVTLEPTGGNTAPTLEEMYVVGNT